MKHLSIIYTEIQNNEVPRYFNYVVHDMAKRPVNCWTKLHKEMRLVQFMDSTENQNFTDFSKAIINKIAFQ